MLAVQVTLWFAVGEGGVQVMLLIWGAVILGALTMTSNQLLTVLSLSPEPPTRTLMFATPAVLPGETVIVLPLRSTPATLVLSLDALL